MPTDTSIKPEAAKLGAASASSSERGVQTKASVVSADAQIARANTALGDAQSVLKKTAKLGVEKL